MKETQLDCRGLQCPDPIVRLFLAMKELDAGDRLVIEATDPAFHPDLAAWILSTGHHLERFEEGEVKRAVIRKREARAA